MLTIVVKDYKKVIIIIKVQENMNTYQMNATSERWQPFGLPKGRPNYKVVLIQKCQSSGLVMISIFYGLRKSGGMF